MGSQLHYAEASLHRLHVASHEIYFNIQVHVSQQQNDQAGQCPEQVEWC